MPTAFETIRPIRGPGSPVPSQRSAYRTKSGCAARTPWLTVAPNSVDRVIRYCAGSTASDPAASRSQRTTALSAPGGHDRTTGTGAHAQPESVHLRAATVVRLKSPLALGHGSHSLLALAAPTRRHDTHAYATWSAVVKLDRSRVTNRRGPRRGRSQPYRHVRATVRGY